MYTFKLLAPILWALCGCGLGWYILKQASHITYVTLADGRKQERALPLLFKMMLPFAPNISRVVEHASMHKSLMAARWQLVASGFEGVISDKEFLAVKMLMPIIGGIIWTTILQVGLLLESLGATSSDTQGVVGSNFITLLMVGILFCWLYPIAWLRKALKQRHLAIQRALPFVLDLLTLSVEAGMDFMSALQRNCENRRLDPLNEELIRTIREIQVGVSRKDALRNLSDRVRLTELRTVCTGLIQADELGVSIGAILRIQSVQMRQQRFERAEKLANQAPTKMLGPLLIFIFPATIIMLLGPMLADIVGGML